MTATNRSMENAFDDNDSEVRSRAEMEMDNGTTHRKQFRRTLERYTRHCAAKQQQQKQTYTKPLTKLPTDRTLGWLML